MAIAPMITFMWMMVEILLYLQVTLGLAGTPSPTIKPLDPAALLPAKSFGFMTFSRDATFNAAWQKSLNALAQSERSELERYMRRDYNLLAQIGLRGDRIAKLGQQLAHLHFCFDSVDRERGPSLALLIETASEQIATEWMAKPGSLFHLRGEARQTDFEGTPIRQIQLQGGPSFLMARRGHVLVLSATPPAVTRYIGLLEKHPEQNLAGTERYKQSIWGGDKRPSTGVFVDIPNVIDAARDSMSRRDAMQFDQIDTVLGLSDMQTLQASLRAGEQGAVLDLGIAFTKGSMPIETMIPLGAAPDSSLLALLPPDTAMFFQLQLQETLALSKLRTFLLKAGKEMETNDFEQLFGAVEQFLGDKVDTVAQELSGHAVVGISPIDWGAMMLRTEGPRPAWPGPPVTFVVGFKEAAAGQARWKKVSAFLSKQLGPVAERQHGEIAYLEIGSRMKVAGAMLGQKLVVCLPAKSMPALIDQYLKKTPGPDVSKLADAGRKPALRLGYTPASWMLIIGGAVSVRYDGAMGHARAARGFGPKKAQKPFKPRKTTLVPPKIRTRPGVSSQLTLGRTSGMLRLRSTIGRTDYARALLGVLRQIDHMQRLSCLQNYRTLYMAYQKYEHLKGRAPASIAEIQQAWRELEIYLPRCSGERGQSSGAGYLFNPKPDAKLADADRILIYDRGDNHHGGRLLLTADGRAHWIAAADFTALARRNGLPAADPARPKKPEGADHLQRRR